MTLYSSNYATLALALAAWGTAGGELVIDQDAAISTPTMPTFSANTAYKLRAEGKRTITYNGSNAYWMLRLYGQNGSSFDVEGDIVFNGANKVNLPIWFDFSGVSGSNRADLRVCGITGTNAKMNTGLSGYDATCIKITGGLDRVLVERCKAINATRTAGVGTPGSQGSSGIQIFGNLTTAANVRHVTVRDCVVENITSEDTPGTTAYTDMDGLLIFQGDEVGNTAPVIERCKFAECAGRAIKLYTELGGGVARDIEVIRGVEGRYGGAIDIAFQHGDGLVENITLRYSNVAHSSPNGTIPVSFAQSADRAGSYYPMQPTVVRKIVIGDTTGVAKTCVIDFYDNTGSTVPRTCKAEDIVDAGTAAQLIRLGQNGSSNVLDVILQNIQCGLTQAGLITDDTLANLKIESKNVRNRNAAVPAGKTLALGAKTVTNEQWRSDNTTSGITLAGLPNYANDAGAAGGGVPVRGEYRNGSVRMIRVA